MTMRAPGVDTGVWEGLGRLGGQQVWGESCALTRLGELYSAGRPEPGSVS